MHFPYYILITLAFAVCPSLQQRGPPARTTAPPKTTTPQVNTKTSICMKIGDDGSMIERKYDDCVDYCCGGQVLKKDDSIQCCGSELHGSPYNPEEEKCCDWWTGFGKAYPKSRFNHRTGCCGANFIQHGIQGCCYGHPNPPEVFNWGYQMCCGGTSVALPTPFMVYVSCCAQKVAYDIRLKSCPCEDGQVLDATATLTRCCSNRYGVKAPYYTATQFCCDGSVGNTDTDFCCGSAVGKTATDMCCDGKIVKKKPGAPLATACCGSTPYNPTNNLCCNDVVTPKSVPLANECCGRDTFNNNLQICCEGRIWNIKKDGDECCGRFAFFKGKGSFCCEGTVHVARLVGGSACCGAGNFYNPRETTDICCNGNMVPSEGKDSCCGNLPFSPSTETCCDGTVHDKSFGTDCCNGFPYNADDEKDICCENGPGIGLKKPACCGGTAYNAGTGSVCCGENIYENLRFPACCVDVGYDASTHTCCGSRVYPNPFGSESTACCGELDPQPYDRLNQKCCNGLRVDIPAGMRADRVECCGDFDAYDPSKQLCCDGEVFEKTLPTTECCGKEKYNSALKLCCKNEEHGEPFLTDFTFGTENTGCCADEVFDNSKKYCCGGVLSASKFTKSGCCGGAEYNMLKQICCEDQLFQISARVPANRAKCCGPKCMYDGPQFCCKDRIYMNGALSTKTCVNY